MTDEFHEHDENEEVFVVWEGKYRCSLIPKGQQDLDLHLIVGEENKIKFCIYPKEDNHNIPHFHACIGNDQKGVSYKIDDGCLIAGQRPKAGNHRKICAYWKRDHFFLATIWNETRPADGNYAQAIVPRLPADISDQEKKEIKDRISSLLKREWFFSIEGEQT